MCISRLFSHPKGYKCWDPQSRRYVTSVDVTFFEGQSFPIPPSSVPVQPPQLKVYCRRDKPPTSSRTAAPPAPPSVSSPSAEIPVPSDLPIALRKGTRFYT